MITISYTKGFSKDERLKLELAVERVNACFGDKFFIHKVMTESYTYTSHSPGRILKNITDGNRPITLKAFRPRWYNWTMKKVVAWVNTRRAPSTMNLNANMMGKPVESIAGTIAHEYCHLVGYGHGKNRPHGSPYYNSVPCKIGKLVKRHRF